MHALPSYPNAWSWGEKVPVYLNRALSNPHEILGKNMTFAWFLATWFAGPIVCLPHGTKMPRNPEDLRFSSSFRTVAASNFSVSIFATCHWMGFQWQGDLGRIEAIKFKKAYITCLNTSNLAKWYLETRNCSCCFSHCRPERCHGDHGQGEAGLE